jgi:hypothetical protein
MLQPRPSYKFLTPFPAGCTHLRGMVLHSTPTFPLSSLSLQEQPLSAVTFYAPVPLSRRNCSQSCNVVHAVNHQVCVPWLSSKFSPPGAHYMICVLSPLDRSTTPTAMCTTEKLEFRIFNLFRYFFTSFHLIHVMQIIE